MHIKLWTTDAISRMDDHVAAHQVGLQKVLESIRQSTEELQNVQRKQAQIERKQRKQLQMEQEQQ